MNDYGVKKAVENLPKLRERLQSINDNYLKYPARYSGDLRRPGQLRRLAMPTILPNGKRVSGLKLDHPRQLALMHALVRFTNLVAANTFSTCELQAPIAEALGCTLSQYRLSSLRYDLSKLRTKGLVEKIPHSHRYRLLPQGYSICLVFLKLFERIYAPLTTGLLRPFSSDANFASIAAILNQRNAEIHAQVEELFRAKGIDVRNSHTETTNHLRPASLVQKLRHRR
ncbi:MAG: hypothetical protein WB586_21725 [Chthoniobacterales bacterium]